MSIMAGYATINSPERKAKANRIESIDLLRGFVMIIMALDNVRDYFHYDAFMFSPTDPSQTNAPLFFTRWITHFCAPVFIFLSGTSAYLYGVKKGKKALSFFLLTRGTFLLLIELFVVGFFRTFNPSFPYFNLQVIWAIGICMIALSAIICLNWRLVLLIATLLIAGHNLLDGIHIQGNTLPAFLWSCLHDVTYFNIGSITIYVHYPVLAWIGVMAAGYCFGKFYDPDYDSGRRKKIFLFVGFVCIVLFIVIRSYNWYGDAARWSVQKYFSCSVMSFLNVTKYPPSLLYLLITIGPALIFLSLAESPSGKLKNGVAIFGRTAMFYYLAHILLIHVFALFGALICGYKWQDMILSTSVNDNIHLRGYGFGLPAVYLIWIGLVFLLYPMCRAFDKYKRANQSRYWLLNYL